ncbi:MAG: OmpH family outer membrane protein, partial [Gemmobacter sp.]
ARDLARRREAERQRFFEAALPVLGQLARDAGAVAILTDQAIVLSFDRIDITDAAIARLDAVLGTGEGPAPE